MREKPNLTGTWSYQYDRYEELVGCRNSLSKVSVHKLVSIIQPFSVEKIKTLKKIILKDSKSSVLGRFYFSKIESNRIYYWTNNKFGKHYESFDLDEDRVDLLYYPFSELSDERYLILELYDSTRVVESIRVLRVASNSFSPEFVKFDYKLTDSNVNVTLKGPLSSKNIELIYETKSPLGHAMNSYFFKVTERKISLVRPKKSTYEAIQLINDTGVSLSENKKEIFKLCSF